MAHEVVLLPAPGVSAAIGRELADELPARLGGDWHGAVDDVARLAEDLDGIAHAARDARDRSGAALAVCLTDVPLRAGKQPLTAALDADAGIGVVSVPGAGAAGQRRRVKRATETIVNELTEQSASGVRAIDLPDEQVLRRGHVLPRGLGHVRLLAGMVRANRPWRALTHLSSAVVAALATGAYVVINGTVWQLSEALGPGRLLATMLLSIAAVLGYLVLAHGLWERPGDRPAKERRLYNAATLITLTLAVTWAYAILFVILLAVSGLLVDSGVMQSTIRQPAEFGTYVNLAWLGASIATVAGGLGSGLESVDDVREAAYGHHQRRRGDC